MEMFLSEKLVAQAGNWEGHQSMHVRRKIHYPLKISNKVHYWVTIVRLWGKFCETIFLSYVRVLLLHCVFVWHKPIEETEM